MVRKTHHSLDGRQCDALTDMLDYVLGDLCVFVCDSYLVLGFHFLYPPDFLNIFAVREPIRQGRGSIGREEIALIPREVCRCQRGVWSRVSTRKNIACG